MWRRRLYPEEGEEKRAAKGENEDGKQPNWPSSPTFSNKFTPISRCGGGGYTVKKRRKRGRRREKMRMGSSQIGPALRHVQTSRPK